MQLSTSTNLLFLRPDDSIFPLPEAMRLMREAGFTVLDMNFYDWQTTPGSTYIGDGWNLWLEQALAAKETLGVRFEQSHAYFYDFLDPCMDVSEAEAEQNLVLRSLECCRQLGVKTVVLHPYTVRGTGYMVRDSKEANLRYFADLLEKTSDSGFVIAIENMVDINIYPQRKYCAVPEELIDLVDAFHDPRIGICWDFEHGDMMRQNQPAIIRQLGTRLAATHVSEQHGWQAQYLMHRLPLFGQIEWKPIMQALREVGYQGCFSYEAHNYLNVLPDSCIRPALEIAYLVGTYLMDLGKESR